MPSAAPSLTICPLCGADLDPRRYPLADHISECPERETPFDELGQ